MKRGGWKGMSDPRKALTEGFSERAEKDVSRGKKETVAVVMV
jgi:hypothetical protein